MNHLKFILIFLILSLNISLSFPCFAKESCHHAINDHKTQFIIGYGSLMNKLSRNKTGETIPVAPIWVKNYQRGFFINPKNIKNFVGFSTSFLTIYPKNNAKFNALALKLKHNKYLKKYDARERGYCRKNIYSEITSYNQQTLPKGEYWIYFTKKKNLTKASKKYPLVQSYIDLFIGGCINIQKEFNAHNFVKNCITTTYGWSKFWLNDRIFPRRPWVYEPNARKIDSALAKYVPSFFKLIKLQ